MLERDQRAGTSDGVHRMCAGVDRDLKWRPVLAGPPSIAGGVVDIKFGKLINSEARVPTSDVRPGTPIRAHLCSCAMDAAQDSVSSVVVVLKWENTITHFIVNPQWPRTGVFRYGPVRGTNGRTMGPTKRSLFDSGWKKKM